MSELAPVALFAYKRPAHLRAAIEALRANPEFPESPIHVFCDGARRSEDVPLVQETRALVRSLLPDAVINEREQNLGLRRSIVDGVGQLSRRYGRVVVVEDDLIVARHFLGFMNAALDHYRDDRQVMQVSGHMFPVELPGDRQSLFLPFSTTWGWATWGRAWELFDPDHAVARELQQSRKIRNAFDLGGAYPYFQMLQRQGRGEVDSWGILWYLSVFGNKGLTLYPARSLVLNAGFDGSGTHCADEADSGERQALDQTPLPAAWPDSIATDEASFKLIQAYLRRRSNSIGKVYRRARALFAR
jgi:hypothetical protein